MNGVCLACGELKHGALALCPGCDHRPTERKDQARHLVASEQVQGAEGLNALARRVQDGETLEFSDQALARAETALDEVGEVGLGLYALAVGAAPVVVFSGVLLLSAWLLF